MAEAVAKAKTKAMENLASNFELLCEWSEYLQKVEAERQRQSQPNASVVAKAKAKAMANFASNLDLHCEGFKYLQEVEAERQRQRQKCSISSIWSFFHIKKLQPSFSSNRSEPFITSSGHAHVFSYKELEKATDCFRRRIGDGGFGSVYLGKLADDRMVAVKVLYEGLKWVKEFTNEVSVLSKLRHPNLVSLLLVYEFVPNGTIYDHLHGKLAPLSWAVRIKIAIETAKALTYLHSLTPPIIHRDVKTSNILLDNDCHVKVADFGMCRLLPMDTTCVTTLPQGTQGYRDPEYDLYCKLTTKSDVYSFGVVLIELISGKQAVDVNREESDIYLFRMALTKIVNKELEKLIDPELGYHSDCENKRMIDSVAGFLWSRFSMEQVLLTLKAIRDGTKPAKTD